jgi:hypothetical protein
VSDQAVVVLLLAVPWAVLGLVALLRGYRITMSRDNHRDRDDHPDDP